MAVRSCAPATLALPAGGALLASRGDEYGHPWPLAGQHECELNSSGPLALS